MTTKTLLEGDSLGSHHRSGVLKFNEIAPLPMSIKRKIFQVAAQAREVSCG